MRRVNPGTVAAIALIFAISSAGAGLVVKLNGTWTAGWRADEVLGVTTLVYLAGELWVKYRRTAHYEMHKHGPVTRLLAWLVTFEDPDGLQVRRRAKRPAPGVERAGKSPDPR
jgi:hypothetical protein